MKKFKPEYQVKITWTPKLKQAVKKYTKASSENNWKEAYKWLTEITAIVTVIESYMGNEIAKQKRGKK